MFMKFENQRSLDTQFIEESLKQLRLSSDRELEVLADQSLSAFARAKIWDLRGYRWASIALIDLFGEKGRTWTK